MDMKALNFLTTWDAGWAREKLRVFLLLWFVLSYVQGVFSGLNEDEPYYYMYAMFPAWGYFDHPPMVGMFAWAGIQMFGKVLGLRLFSAISSTLFLYAVWKLIEHKDKYKYVNVFILMALSIPMVSVYGFMIVPDGPLLFFVSLFLLAYRWFLKSENVLKAILVGVLAAAVLYSKYHGVLVLLLVVASNVKLLRDRYFYVAVLTALVLLVPHITWQVEHDFPSLSYHLYERTADKAYKFRYTWEYPLNQLAVFGPFLFPVMVLAVWKGGKKNPGRMARAMRFLFWGFLAFFFLMTFKGHVEPHWTVVAIIPAMYFTFHYVLRSERKARYFVGASLFSAFLIFVVRVALFLPGLDTPYHHQKEWAGSIHDVAGNAPVVFRDSYQKASMYTYYTNCPAISARSPQGRRNQYDIFPIKDYIRGQRVLFLDGESDQVIIRAGKKELCGRWIEHFEPDSLWAKPSVKP